MRYEIKAPLLFTGEIWGLTFVHGHACTEDVSLAAKLQRKGYLVSEQEPDIQATTDDADPAEGEAWSSADAPPAFICRVCQKPYKTADNLAKHITEKHPEFSPEESPA